MGKRLWLCIVVMLMFLTAQVTPAWCEDTTGSGSTQDLSNVVTQLDNTSGGATITGGDGEQPQPPVPEGSDSKESTTATLHVITQVKNSNEGTKTASDFIVHVTASGSEVSGSHQAAESESVTSYTLDPGDYTISEETQDGYTFSFSGDSDDKGKITLAAGDNKTVTISNQDEAAKSFDSNQDEAAKSFGSNQGEAARSFGSNQGEAARSLPLLAATATLHVVTVVTNSNGGTKTAPDFNVHVTASGSEVPNSPVAVSESGSTYTLAAGDYTVSDNPPPGYTCSFSGDGDVSGNIHLNADDEKTITITNQDLPATLHVITVVNNSNGGTKGSADFTVHVTASNVNVSGTGATSPGAVYTLAAGDYAVSEDFLSGYTYTFSGDGNESGDITLANGDNKTITVTNQDLPTGSLQVESTTPCNKSTDVATGLTQIKIKFNYPIINQVFAESYNTYFFVSGKYNYGIECTPSIDPSDPKTLILSANLPEDDTISVGIKNGAICKDGEPSIIFPTAGFYSFSFKTRSDTAVNVPDLVLNQAIKAQLGIPADRDIHSKKDNAQIWDYTIGRNGDFVKIKAMEDLTEFKYPVNSGQYSGDKITSITGLEAAVNLAKLTINVAELTNTNDLSPLSNLAYLTDVDLNGSKLGDPSQWPRTQASLAPLATLPLTQLNLTNCGITYVTGLAGNPTLQTLQLGGNSIDDIGALSSLTGLIHLELGSNEIYDISALGNLTGLTYLDLSSNHINCFTPITSLTALQELILTNTNLTQYYVDNDLSEIYKLTNLTRLHLGENYIEDISFLKDLPGLTILDLHSNNIQDISPLSNLIKLLDLNVSQNHIYDLKALLDNCTSNSSRNWVQIDVTYNMLNLPNELPGDSYAEGTTPTVNETQLKEIRDIVGNGKVIAGYQTITGPSEAFDRDMSTPKDQDINQPYDQGYDLYFPCGTVMYHMDAIRLYINGERLNDDQYTMTLIDSGNDDEPVHLSIRLKNWLEPGETLTVIAPSGSKRWKSLPCS